MLETTGINTIEDCLEKLNVSEMTLTGSQKTALDSQGYLVIEGLFKAGPLAELQDYYEELMTLERSKAGLGGKETQGTRHWGDPGPYLAKLAVLYTQPLVLAAAYHILKRNFRIGSLSGRDPLPGYGQQGLHSDWSAPTPDKFFVVNTIWSLDDFTVSNGATRIVPGSHLSYERVSKQMAQPSFHHTKEVFVTMPAGSVLIFNSHIWHSGTMNQSKTGRRAILCMFATRDQPQFSSNFPTDLPDLSPAARYLLTN